jgi:hypothetical protein
MPKPGSRPRIASPKPEYADIKGLQQLFGIRETLAYRLLLEGKITGVVIKGEGKQRGKRLISLASVRKYLASLREEEVTP